MGGRYKLVESKSIPTSMWIATCLVALSSFMFGFALASLNSCLVLGDGNDAKACYDGTDDKTPHCPVGTLYNDMDLNACKYRYQ